ncbi:FG-GAP-like repeat-containing protein [Streptomyces cinereoruber]|uniref:FG-GAP-like repeat-containing protein n=1 Tax=Streptomyces cinereoruber TaxID=67260 RepID=UPI00363EBA2A
MDTDEIHQAPDGSAGRRHGAVRAPRDDGDGSGRVESRAAGHDDGLVEPVHRRWCKGGDSFCPSRLTTTETAEKVDQIVALIRERNLDAIVLQEACGEPEGFVPTPGAPASDQKRLMTKLQNADGTTDWSFYFTPLTRGDDVLDPVEKMGSHCQGAAYGKGGSGKVGNLIAVKGKISAPDQINSVPVTTKDKLRLPVQCVVVEGKSTGVCNTHIIAKTYEADSRVQGQIKNVRDFVQSFRAKHQLQFIALGGDFNRPVEEVAVMPDANGDLVKQQVLGPLTTIFENCIDGTTHHGWYNTDRHAWHEYDHIFVTRRDEGSAFSSCDIDMSRLDTSPNELNEPTNGYSDHAPVIARLGGDRTPGDLSGDGKPDLVAIDTAGRLRLYHGDGKGGIAPYLGDGFAANYEEIGDGGWLGASVSHRGDFTRDGLEDVVARVGTELRVYPSRFAGTRLAPPTVVAKGLPTNAQVVTAGDMNNDGDADIVVSADGRLWLYENDSNAAILPAVQPRVEIGGNGGWSPMTITAPGDMDKDNRPDLLVRDTRDGYLYRYDGSTMFGTRTQIGYGYSTTNRPLIAGAADANRDGAADMWTTTETGTLTFYGNPAGGANTVVGASGWGTITAIS